MEAVERKRDSLLLHRTRVLHDLEGLCLRRLPC